MHTVCKVIITVLISPLYLNVRIHNRSKHNIGATEQQIWYKKVIKLTEFYQKISSTSRDSVNVDNLYSPILMVVV